MPLVQCELKQNIYSGLKAPCRSAVVPQLRLQWCTSEKSSMQPTNGKEEYKVKRGKDNRKKSRKMKTEGNIREHWNWLSSLQRKVLGNIQGQ